MLYAPHHFCPRLLVVTCDLFLSRASNQGLPSHNTSMLYSSEQSFAGTYPAKNNIRSDQTYSAPHLCIEHLWSWLLEEFAGRASRYQKSSLSDTIALQLVAEYGYVTLATTVSQLLHHTSLQVLSSGVLNRCRLMWFDRCGWGTLRAEKTRWRGP